MNAEFPKDLLWRAGNAMRSAEALLAVSPDDAASRAYYAAFHAASAALILAGKEFGRHSAVRAGVHKHLVKAGVWSVELGADFDSVWELRDLGDYGGPRHVAAEDAAVAVQAARRILQAIRDLHPELQA